MAQKPIGYPGFRSFSSAAFHSNLEKLDIRCNKMFGRCDKLDNADVSKGKLHVIDWEEIVSRHGRIVWNTAYRVLGNHADALDCHQDTFLAAVEFSRRHKVRDWPALLQHLATVRAIDRLRRRMSDGKHRDVIADVSSLATSDPGPAQRAEESELIDCLRQALTELPDNQAAVYCLRCFNDLSYEQIADRLGIGVNHVGVLLHRARGRLQTMLGPCMKTWQPGTSDE